MRNLTAKEEGFTLVEALAALAILAVVLSTLLTGISGAARNDSRAEFALVATRFAQSRLALAGVAEPLLAGRLTGVSDEGLAWEQATDSRETLPGAPQVFWIRVSVWPSPSPGNGSPLTLETARIARPALAP